MSLFRSLDVAASGMSAQRMRTELAVENIANAETTRTAEGGPYRKKLAILESQAIGSPFGAIFHREMGDGLSGVGVSSVVEDPRDPDMRYMPSHPDADKEGYVAFPRMNPVEEMADLMSANRSWGANATAMSVVKEMIGKSVDLLK
jgi:flagellar basal-body rod protein FlgC